MDLLNRLKTKNQLFSICRKSQYIITNNKGHRLCTVEYLHMSTYNICVYNKNEIELTLENQIFKDSIYCIKLE